MQPTPLARLALLTSLGFTVHGAFADTSAAGTQTPQLEEITVKTSADVVSPYQTVISNTATKLDAPLRDIPQTINVVPNQLIRDQSAQSMQDVLRNVPGIGFSNGDGQRDQVNIRGFSAIADQFVDGIRDDALYFRDLANVEQVEVLKGPAAVLYGRGSSGGIINRITKKPVDKAMANLTMTLGSYDSQRYEADVNQPLADNVGFRINAARQKADGFRQQNFIDREFIAPSLQLDISEKSRLLLQAEYLDDRRLNDFGIPAVNGRPARVSIKTYYGSSDGRHDDYVQSRVSAGTIVFEHSFNDDVKLRNAFRAYSYDLDRNNTVVTRVNTSTANPVLSRRYSTVQRQEDGYFNQTDLSIKAKGWGLEHALLFGMEIGEQVKDAFSGDFTAPSNITLYNSVLTDSVRSAILSGISDSTGTSKTTGLYMQDLVSLTEHWKALLGVRFDRFNQRSEDNRSPAKVSRIDEEWSPRAGLVYQPTDTISIYGSYSKSFQPSQENFNLGFSNNAAQLAPEKTTNYEIGAKLDWLEGKLSTMVSLFSLERTNIKSTDPTNGNLQIPIGEQRTNGLELSAMGRLADHWDISAGYAYMDAEITKSPSLASVPIGPSTYRVAIEGNQPGLTPRHSANLWLSHRFGNGFGIGGGAVLMGEQYTSVSNAVKLPGYTRFDASAYYETAHYDLRLTVNNLMDKEYFISAHGGADLYNTPGAPRSAWLSLTLKL
ncbi:TonB-dependent siderophore receptor [Methylobacillus gramineus]|uniref:TonB-dependent receptor n=1 Tax=Methylobacillus gramineus TaxID=755169 RepID=UPI001CFFD4CD|nr:TonB-dependent siderophore receptor [Methylobacillus gramineus]MCB5184804.1 TonB-dependent siderophore receptor [Methylobacillus gramineus]